jgi:hypothetical protein
LEIVEGTKSGFTADAWVSNRPSAYIQLPEVGAGKTRYCIEITPTSGQKKAGIYFGYQQSVTVAAMKVRVSNFQIFDATDIAYGLPGIYDATRHTEFFPATYYQRQPGPLPSLPGYVLYAFGLTGTRGTAGAWEVPEAVRSLPDYGYGYKALYVDENSQPVREWVCNEVDFEAGNYTRRVAVFHVPKNTGSGEYVLPGCDLRLTAVWTNNGCGVLSSSPTGNFSVSSGVLQITRATAASMAGFDVVYKLAEPEVIDLRKNLDNLFPVTGGETLAMENGAAIENAVPVPVKTVYQIEI